MQGTNINQTGIGAGAGTETRRRTQYDLYPDCSAELAAIEAGGITPELIKKIIDRHAGNAARTQSLYDRYRAMDSSLPIHNRRPRFDEGTDTINNQLNNDFFGEIVNFKTGYFAGKAIAYSYSSSEESEEETGGIPEVELAKKALSDFVTRNNLYDVDMETTKLASICGYCGRGDLQPSITPSTPRMTASPTRFSSARAGMPVFLMRPPGEWTTSRQRRKRL